MSWKFLSIFRIDSIMPDKPISLNETEKTLFDLVELVVLSVGGDGWGYISSPDYRRLAQLFEEKDTSIFREKIVSETNITFICGQEFVKFCDIKDTPEHADIFVRLDWPTHD